MKFGCSIGIFLNSAHLICRSKDISKCFRGSLRLRDNESRLYLRMNYRFEKITLCQCMNFRWHFTYNLRGAWHTLYVMLLLNCGRDDTIDLLSWRIWSYQKLCLPSHAVFVFLLLELSILSSKCELLSSCNSGKSTT